MASLIQQISTFFNYYNVMLLLWGISSTVLLTLIGCGAGFTFGAVIALTRTARSIWLLPLKVLFIAYVEFFRRIPFLVILFIVLFAAQVISPTISLFGIAAISICLLSTSYLSEIIRAGIESVPRPQVEAAEAMNFSRGLTIRQVVLPQAWKVILPPATSFVIMFIKDTSLVSQMGVTELMFTGKTPRQSRLLLAARLWNDPRLLFRPVLSAEPPRRLDGEETCHTSASEISTPATGKCRSCGTSAFQSRRVR
jgi:polar amino acid transport system permease protein